ncbi:proton-conducting transporter transmembrane domain-containing protein [Halosimplex sp. J119]
MTDHTRPNDGVQLSDIATSSDSTIPRASTATVWALFLLAVGVLGLSVAGGGERGVAGVFVVDGLTAVAWVVVTFFSGIIHSYSRRYMAGDSHLDGFFVRIFGFTLAVMAMTAADHVALLAAAWLAMGLVMASLVGHVRGWDQAQAAARCARRYFLASATLLTVGLAVLVWSTGSTSISGILDQVETVPQTTALAAVSCLVLAAVIQSALVPFHRWLLSSMTAPTPASALMHAGFVNAGGILLTRFAPLVTSETAVMLGIVVVGAVSALFGQALILIQTDVKRELGASTVAQMGFMILQCGLGFFAAAVTHLVLHGFYKAYLFLSSGSAVEQTAPDSSKHSSPTPAGIAVGLLTALAGGVLFAVLTGKGTKPDSGLVLTAVVVLTTMHATRDVVRRSSLSAPLRLLGLPLVALTAIGTYAAVFEAISAALADVPMTAAPTDLTVVHLGVVALFVLAYAATEFGWHRASKRLYVALLNASQPHPDTILTSTEDYDDA